MTAEHRITECPAAFFSSGLAACLYFSLPFSSFRATPSRSTITTEGDVTVMPYCRTVVEQNPGLAQDHRDGTTLCAGPVWVDPWIGDVDRWLRSIRRNKLLHF